MPRKLTIARRQALARPRPSSCDHRTVSKNGRIICAKIVKGGNVVSPDICKTCPVMVVNCTHLRFSLRQTSPSPLIVRFNGRTEVWDDEPPAIHLQEAACVVNVAPVKQARTCLGCAQRKPVDVPVEQPVRQRRQVAACGQVGGCGKVVPFPPRSPLPTAG